MLGQPGRGRGRRVAWEPTEVRCATNDSTWRLRDAVEHLCVYVAAFTCHTVTGPLHHRLAQYMVAIFSASRDHRIAVFHRLRFPTFRHSDITTSRPSHCCVVTVSITTSLHAQRMSATFAACQHPRIPISTVCAFRHSDIPTSLHHCTTGCVYSCTTGPRLCVLLHHRTQALCITAQQLPPSLRFILASNHDAAITASLHLSRFHSRPPPARRQGSAPPPLRSPR